MVGCTRCSMPFAVRTATPSSFYAIAKAPARREDLPGRWRRCLRHRRRSARPWCRGEAGEDRKFLRGVCGRRRRMTDWPRHNRAAARPSGIRRTTKPVLLHPGQDVVAGAVENAVDAVDLVAPAQTPRAGLDDCGSQHPPRASKFNYAPPCFSAAFASRKPCLGDQRLVGG